MSKHIQSLLLTILLIWLSTTAWGITSYTVRPGFGAPSYSQTQLDAAVANAKATWLGVGHTEAATQCLADPKTCGCNYGLKPCGISLSSLLTGSKYGETEPNDAPEFANPMEPDKIYWGQSMDAQDQDWFYVTTEEPNQIITLNFRVPSAVYSSDYLTWDISVRNAAGEILAKFDSTLAMDTGDITYPVFVSAPGTYYVVVQSSSNTVNHRAYNLIANISFSDSDAPPVDVNFTDVESEPNNDYATADTIANDITMYGMLASTLVGSAKTGWSLQTEEDWFKYTSKGNEMISLAWCKRESCTPTGSGRSWRVSVLAQDNTVMTSFDAAGPKTVRFGIANAGDYYIQVMSELLTNTDPATGTTIIQTICRQWSTGQDPVCLSYTPVATTATDQYNFTWQGINRK